MTREEAIKLIGGMKSDLNDFYDYDDLAALDMAISALSAEPCRETDDYENEIADLHNRLDIAEYDKERYKEEITILEAENKGEWIPVSERLPEMGVRVLCACQADLYDVLKLTPNGWFYDTHHTYMLGFVRAWQPLPEPYKKGGE